MTRSSMRGWPAKNKISRNVHRNVVVRPIRPDIGATPSLPKLMNPNLLWVTTRNHVAPKNERSGPTRVNVVVRTESAHHAHHAPHAPLDTDAASGLQKLTGPSYQHAEKDVKSDPTKANAVARTESICLILHFPLDIDGINF